MGGSSSPSRDAIAGMTLSAFGSQRLVALCDAVGAGAESAALLGVFRALLRPWGERRIGESPRYRSNVADDGAPFEFSIALSDGAPEVQVYVEVQAEPPALYSNMLAGRAVLETIAAVLGAPLDRLRQVEPLFFPETPQEPFTIWIGASWAAGREVKLKVYLNPQVRGRERAVEVTGQAMERLGFGRAWSRFHQGLSFGDGRRDELGILSLDLSKGSLGRVKIYVRHHRATVQDIDAIAKISEDYNAHDLAAFYLALAENPGPYLSKPPLTEMIFTDPGSDRPSAITFEFPIGSYSESDADAQHRIKACLATFGLQGARYDKAIRAFATRPLGESCGIHAHVTFCRTRRGPRVAAYFASEAYTNQPRAAFE